MSKFVNAVILGLVSFVLILAVFWYVIEIRQDSQVQITDVAVAWGPANSRTTELQIALSVHNPHRSPVDLVEIRYEVIVNGNQLAEEVVNESTTIEPERGGSKSFVALVPSRFVVDWIDSHLENNERSRMQIRGQALFRIATLETISPFEWESSWEGLYLDGFSAALRNCPSTTSAPCIASTMAEWDTNGTQSVLQTIFQINNPSDHSLRIKSWSVDLVMQNVTVARGGTPQTFSVAPNGQVEIRAPVVFERPQMPLWWPLHVQDCEKSRTTVLVKYLYEEDQAAGAENQSVQTVVTSVTWEFAAPRFDTRFVCESP